MGRKDRGYKRRWRNLLLNARYQLSFTTLLVGLAALLMGALGWWVKDKAFVATDVAANSVIELQCPEMPEVVARTLHPMPKAAAAPGSAANQNDQIPDQEPPVKDADDGDPIDPDELDSEEIDPDDPLLDAGAEDRPRPRVIIDESTIEQIAPVVDPATMTGPTLENIDCRIGQSFKIQPLWSRYRLIIYVLFGTTIFLVFALAFYGIKMTHKVAGPLYKVGLYLDKLAKGKYDTVWNLRKGDQLTEFYEHFKAAHAGLSEMQVDDIELIEKVCEALAEVDDKSPELEKARAELAELLESKRDNYQVGGKS